MTTVRRAAGSYLRFLALVVALTAIAALLGFLPTKRLGGPEALPAMAAGCLIGLVASALGAVPIALAQGSPRAGLQGIVAAMAVRFAVAVALGLAAVLSGEFERGPLLIWIAIAYAIQLVADTRYALGAFQGKKDLET